MLYLMLQWDCMIVRRSTSLLVFTYLENYQKSSTGKKMSLYRDDWLSVIENANGPKLDRLRKNVIAIFHNEELKITIDTNLTTTDFLDVTLVLFTGK